MARVAASTVLVLGAVLAVGGVMGLADVLDEGQGGNVALRLLVLAVHRGGDGRGPFAICERQAGKGDSRLRGRSLHPAPLDPGGGMNGRLATVPGPRS